MSSVIYVQCENFCTATVISTLPYRCLQPPSISSFLPLLPFPCFIVAQFHRERKKDVYAGCTHSGENREEQRRWRVSILRSWKCDCLSSPSFFLPPLLSFLRFPRFFSSVIGDTVDQRETVNRRSGLSLFLVSFSLSLRFSVIVARIQRCPLNEMKPVMKGAQGSVNKRASSCPPPPSRKNIRGNCVPETTRDHRDSTDPTVI